MKKGLDEIKTMGPVYASPEEIDNHYKDCIEERQEKPYPYSYAVEDELVFENADIEKELVMQELYGGPEMFTGGVASSDTPKPKIDYDASGITDPDETLQFCRECGRTFAMKLIACPYCGMIAREERKYDRETDNDFDMGTVYASPEMMVAHKQKKRGLFGALFRGRESKNK